MAEIQKEGLNPVYLALKALRRRKFDTCASVCTELLDKNPLDEAAWYLKCKSLVEKKWIDDTELEEEGVAELLLDNHSLAQTPRPGTSVKKSQGTTNSTNINQGVRPMTGSGRPLTGFARPGTSTRASNEGVESAFQSSRPNTSRPVTSSGRFVRIGTASLMSEPGGVFINVDKLNLRKYASKPILAKLLFQYLLYSENNPKKALDLALLVVEQNQGQDWWWFAQVGKCYYRLGMMREAEQELQKSINIKEMLNTYLWLCKVFLRIDQPNNATDLYLKALTKFPDELSLILGAARLYDQLSDIHGMEYYKKALQLDSSNIEAIASLASYQFYTDQPELALRYYRRLLQMGINNAEIWNNLGLCCLYAQQYDMTLGCFERALLLSDDDNMADVWFNLGQLSIGIGDTNLAYQSFQIAISINSKHAESFNNLGVLEMKKGNLNTARSHFQTASQLAPYLHDSFFNEALLMFRMGNFQKSYQLAQKALNIFSNHEESKELMFLLNSHFSTI